VAADFIIHNDDVLLERVVERLGRGGSPDDRWPDDKGDFWALCPFHSDTTWGSFHVGPKGYKCF